MGLAKVSPILARHLQSCLDGGGSIVGVKHALESGRQQRQQALREFDGGAVRASREHYMLQLSRLGGQRFVQFRMRVAMNIDPPGRYPVENTSSILGEKVHALGARDRQRISRVEHLRIGMPQGGTVAIT